MTEGNTIYLYRHIITGNKLGDKEYTFNDVKEGGTKKITDFGLVRNSFFGGNVTLLGFIPELGFYACQNAFNNRVVGFFIDRPDRVTDLGRKLLKERLKGYELVYEKPQPKEMSEQERQRQRELKALAVEQGIAAEVIDTYSAKEIEGLLAAIEAGSMDKNQAVEAAPVRGPVLEKPIKVKTMVNGKLPKTFSV